MLDERSNGIGRWYFVLIAVVAAMGIITVLSMYAERPPRASALLDSER